MNRYQVKLRSPTPAEYQFLRKTTDWFQLADNIVAESLKNELFSVCVFDQKQIIGMGRVVGDGAIYFYIQDIIVHPDYQNLGLGRRIMESIEEYLQNNCHYNSFVGLMAAEGLIEFYHKFGYEVRPSTKPGMYKMIR
jgi:ribosomal protein S18 acetylase RimI-like enzyme